MTASTRIDNPLELHSACVPWLGHSSQVRVPWLGAVTDYIPATVVSLAGNVEPGDGADMTSADVARLHLLTRAHELITFLAASGWVLNDAPVMDFRGHLESGRWTIGGEMAEPPQEYGICLMVSLELIASGLHRVQPSRQRATGERQARQGENMNADIKPRRAHQRWPIVDVIAGGVLVLARLIAPGVPGLVFRDSISQVQGICASNLGALAQTADSSVAHGCANASTAMTVLNVAAALGVVLLAVGGANLLLKAIRQAQRG